jgi:acyl-CoA synthetase (NDP forming)/GNAT superfamily N-acetyltransferase
MIMLPPTLTLRADLDKRLRVNISDPGKPAVSDVEEGADALLMDGRIVHVRPVSEADTDALTALYTRASPRSRYLRFFSAGISIDREVQRLVVRRDEHVALVAEHDGVVVGVASYEPLSGAQAEIALLVDDAWQGDGIGSLLIEHLAALARRAGIQELVGDVLATNVTMLRTSASLAPGIARDHGEDPGVVCIHIPTQPDERALAASGARDRTAEHNSLRPLLAPASLAVIGVSRSQSGVGYEILHAVLAGGFTGRAYPVNPHAKTLDGLDCYSSVGAIPEHVDLAVIAVPAPRVEQVIEECGAAQVGAAVVLSAGFGETGPSGMATESRLLASARRHDIRVVGPNCIGVVNTDPWVRLNATFAPSSPTPGHLAVASQSGAVGVAILDSAERGGVGISTFVSLGNKIDVSTNDLLSYWYDDVTTQAVALYVESFGNPRRFTWLARALSTRKPILAVKSGRSASGRRAGSSHTAAAAAPDVAVDTLFRQAGVLRMDTLGELLDAARLLTEQPLPAGDRVAIVGNAGGLNILAADAAEAAGLKVVEFSATLQQKFADLAPHLAGVANPMDLGADAPPATIGLAIRALGSSGEADALVVTLVATRANDLPGALAALSEAAGDQSHLPIVAVVVGGDSPLKLGKGNLPVYELPEDAVRSLGHACRYARWRREPTGSKPALAGIDREAAQRIIAAAVADGAGWQPVAVTHALMACYDIPLLETRLASSMESAEEMARELGFPVAMKATRPGLVHKSELGGVHLGLSNESAMRDAYLAIARSLDEAEPQVALQRMVQTGVELVVGVAHDSLFGSLVMLGLGGVHTDLLGDRTFRSVPLTDRDAATMWRELRAAPLLTGYRGTPAMDTDALEQLLLRVAQLAEDLPEVLELDLNPVVPVGTEVAALDVKLKLQPTEEEPDAYVRSLDIPRSHRPNQ